MKTKRIRRVVVVLLLVSGVVALAQWRGRRGDFGSGMEGAQPVRGNFMQGGVETPTWTNAPGFEKDVFTFARVIYQSGSGGWGRRRGGGWATDIADSDLNLSWRLQQMTSMKVDPDARVLQLTNPDLADYPFIYIVEPGGLYLSDEEVLALRSYLLNGGFLMLDDFWGDPQWDNCEEELRKVFPDRSFVELRLDHPLYTCLFKITAKHQVPNVGTGIQSQWGGPTWEGQHGGDTRTVHHRAIFDDQGRMMVIAFHNTDNGDGWEWEGADNYYFRNFSEKIAYPLAINTLFYVMTH